MTGDGLDQFEPGLGGHVMPHSFYYVEFRTGNCFGGGDAVGEGNKRIGIAVNDQRGHCNGSQRFPATAGNHYGCNLPGQSRQ